MDTYSRLTKRITESIAVCLFLAILILQTLNIFFRYTKLVSPLMWVKDFSQYSLIWMFFLLWHLADREGAHFVVDFVAEKVPARVKKLFDLTADVVAIAFSGIVVWSSVWFISETMHYSTQSFSWLPMGAVYLVIPIGLLLVLIERLRLFFQKLGRSSTSV